jgi:hypothetical protein
MAVRIVQRLRCMHLVEPEFRNIAESTKTCKKFKFFQILQTEETITCEGSTDCANAGVEDKFVVNEIGTSPYYRCMKVSKLSRKSCFFTNF